MSDNRFFEEPKEPSLIKSRIVEKYFDAWAKVVIGTQKRRRDDIQKIAYIDLFSGPGCYKDGTKSTPFKILDRAINNLDLKERLVAVFNDKNKENADDLRESIQSISGIETLKNKPVVWNKEVGAEIVGIFEKNKLVPTLFFIDPWGYKGLSLRLMKSVLKDWGCDGIFFFNYNRINMGMNNDFVMKHMQDLFGEERAISLGRKLENKPPEERELIITEEMCEAIKKEDLKYVLPFRFKNDKGNRTSHYLFFVTKHLKGYEIMKDVMSKESSSDGKDVPTFEYIPAGSLPQQTLLFQLSRTPDLDGLEKELLDKFRGQRLSVRDIYENHNVDTPYVLRNYKHVLRKLYDNGSIKAISENGKPPRDGTFGDKIIVTFPE